MKLLSSFCLLFIVLCADSQTRFYVKGHIDAIKDGEILRLFRYRDGSMDAACADTLSKGNFSLSDTVSQPTLYWILGSGDHFPGYALEIWATPGATIHVSGNGYHLKTWHVKSASREQQEANRYLAPSIGDWNYVQDLATQTQKTGRKMKLDSIMAHIDWTQIQLLAKYPVTEIWLHAMFNLSFGALLNPQIPYRQSILQLYQRMTDRQRASPTGEKITANLFPPTVVKNGEVMADMPLLDTQLVTHRLANYKDSGKYLLLDFWFIACGPCMAAIPETKRLYDSLASRLTIIGINEDETAFWKSKATEKPIPWANLNDAKGRSGLAARYGVRGFPHYVMISPEGIVLGAWTGYDEGELTRKVGQYVGH